MRAFVDRLRGRDPSVPLAVASLLGCRVLEGEATIADLAVAYRTDHLTLHRGLTGTDAQQRGTLSVDEARRFIEGSIIPRLVTEGILKAVENGDGLFLTPEAAAALAAAPDAARASLLDLAAEIAHQAEAPVAEPVAPVGSILTGTGLTKVYRKRAVVDRVNLEVGQGEIVGLLGPNGAGKTTTFYMLVGLIKPDAGDVLIDGESIRRLPMFKRARQGIGYLAQEPSVFRRLSVEKNVLAILETMKLSAAERRERLESLLEELSIKHLRKTPAYQLSGGERRRLEITRALVTNPKFMLLDEPFAGVDPIAVHDIQTIVAGLRRRGIGVLITDHNVEQTLDIVDRAYIMFDGAVQVSGTVADLVFNERVADLYLGPTLTARLRERLGAGA